MHGFSWYFWLSLLEKGDFSEFLSEFFNIKNGTLDRRSYYVCTSLLMGMACVILAIILVFLMISTKVQISFLHMKEKNQEYFIYGLVWLVCTPIQLSGFLRRMNDADCTKWVGLIFLLPIVGNAFATLIAALPTSWGVNRYY